MNNRIIILSAAALAIMALIVFQQRQKSRTISELPFSSLTINDIEGIHAKRGSESMEIALTDNTWMITHPYSFPADESKIRDRLEALSAMRLDGIISEDETKDSVFGLTQEDGLYFTVIGKDAVRTEIRVGNEAGGFNTGYVKIETQPQIYISPNISRERLFRNPDEWRDMRIFKDITSVPESFVWKEKGRTFAWTHRNGQWYDTYFSTDTIAHIFSENLTKILNLRGIDIKTGYVPETAADIEMIFSMTPSQTKEAFWYRDRENASYYVKKPDDDYAYSVPVYFLENLKNAIFPEE